MTKIQVNSQGKAYLTTAGKALTGVQPTLITKSITENGTYNASSDNADGYSSVTVNVSGGGGSTKYGCTVDNLLGDVDTNGVLQMPSAPSGDIVFSGVKDVIGFGLAYKFYSNRNLTNGVSFPDLEDLTNGSSLYLTFDSSNLSSVSLPKLKTITGSYGCYNSFAGTRITSFSLPELTTISNTSSAYGMCRDCSLLVNAYFPKLSVVTGSNCLSYCFSTCTSIEHIYFNALTTTSFGSYTNQFYQIVAYTGTSVTHTIHFPSNLESIIQGLSGYPNFGGTSGYVTLAFDLPATT